jgi:hypothetical protein
MLANPMFFAKSRGNQVVFDLIKDRPYGDSRKIKDEDD